MTQRHLLPDRRSCEHIKFNYGSLDWIISIGRFDDGSVSECFINCSHAENELQCVARDASVVLSIAFQYHISPEVLRRSVTRLENGKPASIIGEILDLIVRL